MSKETPEIEVFMVHGTFAKSAEWVGSSSKISSRINQSTSAQTIPFFWSGKNSHQARAIAATELADQLIQAAERQRRVAIIAHSHGGNVALGAIRILEGSADVDRFICLGTPFLFCEPNKNIALMKVHRFVFGFLIFILASLLCGLGTLYFLFEIVGYQVVDEDMNVPFTLMGKAGLMISMVLAGVVTSGLQVWIRKRHEPLVSSLQWPICKGTRMQNYQVKRDEARLVVSLFSRLSRAPAQAFEDTINIVSKRIRSRSFWAAMLGVVLIGGLILEFFPESYLTIAAGLTIATVLTLPFLVVALLLFLGAISVLSPLLRSHIAAFGWEGLTQQYIYNVDITDDPSPYWSGTVETRTLKPNRRFWKIRHSAFYDDETVIQNVADFLGL